MFREPPDAERHVRWCGRWGRAIASGDPIAKERPTSSPDFPVPQRNGSRAARDRNGWNRCNQRLATRVKSRRTLVLAEALKSLLQRRIGNRSAQRIDPKCRPKIRHAALLQLSPMPSGVTGNGGVLDGDGSGPVIRRHEHAATESSSTCRVPGDQISTKNDVRRGAAVLVDGAAVAARADFVLAVVALMPPVWCLD